MVQQTFHPYPNPPTRQGYNSSAHTSTVSPLHAPPTELRHTHIHLKMITHGVQESMIPHVRRHHYYGPNPATLCHEVGSQGWRGAYPATEGAPWATDNHSAPHDEAQPAPAPRP